MRTLFANTAAAISTVCSSSLLPAAASTASTTASDNPVLHHFSTYTYECENDSNENGNGICEQLHPLSNKLDTKSQMKIDTFQIDDIVEVRDPHPSKNRIEYAVPAQIKRIVVSPKEEAKAKTNHLRSSGNLEGQADETSYSIKYDVVSVSGSHYRVTPDLDSSVIFPMEVYESDTRGLCYFRKPMPCTILEYLPGECPEEIGGCYSVEYEVEGKKVKGKAPLIRIQRLISDPTSQKIGDESKLKQGNLRPGNKGTESVAAEARRETEKNIDNEANANDEENDQEAEEGKE